LGLRRHSVAPDPPGLVDFGLDQLRDARLRLSSDVRDSVKKTVKDREGHDIL
jgi:hypothetical protein